MLWPWLVSLSAMWFGWGALSTMLGVSSLVLGSVTTLGLFAVERTPTRGLAATAVLSLGWLPVFWWQPWLLLIAAAALAWGWRMRRVEQERWAKVDRAYDRERMAPPR